MEGTTENNVNIGEAIEANFLEKFQRRNTMSSKPAKTKTQKSRKIRKNKEKRKTTNKIKLK